MSNPFGVEEGVIAPEKPAAWQAMLLPTYPPQTAWSHSAVTQHKNCPRVIRYRRIDRIEEPKSVHLARGISVHEAIAAYIEGKADDFPEFLDPTWLPLMRSMREGRYAAEHEIAVRSDWTVADDWFAKDVWGRVAFDVMKQWRGSADLWDWKTGKRYPDSELDQAKLYAFVAMKVYSEPLAVTVRFAHVDRPKPLDSAIPTYVFSRQELVELEEWFDKWTRPFLTDTMYPATPSWRCNNCHFRRTNQGPCEHG